LGLADGRRQRGGNDRLMADDPDANSSSD